MKIIINKVKKFPLKPGVYLFVSTRGKILYVGRATSLRRRVLQYFPASERRGSPNFIGRQKNLNPRLSEMVEKAKDIKFFKTENLLEAIILEANLIKKCWPKYNVREKDNRSFIYIAIPKTDFPQPLIIRARELNKFPISKADVFGPYQSLSLVKNFLRIIRRIFPYSTCRVGQGRPCFDYQIGLCPGACIGAISKEDYQKNIDDIILLLSGKKKNLLKKLQKENPDKAKILKHIQDVSLITREENVSGNFYRIEGYDISHLTGRETYGSMVVFTNNKPDKNNYRLFRVKEAPANDDLRALAEVISRRFHHPEWHLPDLIMIDGGKPQISFVSKMLKSRMLKEGNIEIPIVGISKYAGDRLVFPSKMKKSLRQLIEMNKSVLLEVREEAHRFSLRASRRERRRTGGY